MVGNGSLYGRLSTTSIVNFIFSYLYILDTSMAGFKIAITITLNPKLRRYDTPDQYDLTYEAVVDALREVFPGCEISLIAEMHKTHDVHYHGVIRLKKALSELNASYKIRQAFRNHQKFGYCCLKTLMDESKWIDYLSKDLTPFRELVDRPPIVMDDFEYFKDQPPALHAGYRF